MAHGAHILASYLKRDAVAEVSDAVHIHTLNDVVLDAISYFLDLALGLDDVVHALALLGGDDIPINHW